MLTRLRRSCAPRIGLRRRKVLRTTAPEPQPTRRRPRPAPLLRVAPPSRWWDNPLGGAFGGRLTALPEAAETPCGGLCKEAPLRGASRADNKITILLSLIALSGVPPPACALRLLGLRLLAAFDGFAPFTGGLNKITYILLSQVARVAPPR